MKQSTLISKYNAPETVVVVASYPGRKNRSIKDIDAVASYTDHFSRAFQKELAKHGQKLVILAQKDGKETCYEENGILICRVWDKGSVFCYSQIAGMLMKLPHVKTVLVQFEFHQFGGKETTAAFPLFMAALKLMGKSVTLVMHQVVEDITTLSGHVNIMPGSKRATIFNAVLHAFYTIVTPLADAVVVHNEILKDRLEKITGRKDIVVIPHGLGALKQTYTKTQARKRLGMKPSDYIVMSFGFLTWYKGADWIVKQFATIPALKRLKLVMAGGESANLKNEAQYKKYINGIYETAKNHKNIHLTGFVEDKDIAIYFAACDMVVLPYRTLMSSSGPMAMTIAFKKPFIFSTALSDYTHDADMQSALKATGLTANDITFGLTAKSLTMKLATAKRNSNTLEAFSSLLYESRRWENVATRFWQVTGASAILKRPTLAYATTS